MKNQNKTASQVKNSNLLAPNKNVTNATSVNSTPAAEIGCSLFSLFVYNALEDSAPLPICLAAANDNKLTEYVIKDIAKQYGHCKACDFVVDSALYMTKTIAEQECKEEVVTAIEFILDQLDEFNFRDDLTYLNAAADAIKELASKPGYTGLMNVALTALHVQYVF